MDFSNKQERDFSNTHLSFFAENISGSQTGTTTTLEKVFLGVALEMQQQLVSGFGEPLQKILVLAGPTGCGKTALSLDLAESIGGEIISADSMQVYRGMDIGTAKATVEERKKIPHHLIDIRNVSEGFNVVDFYYEARQACRNILQKGKIPIVTGGSGFYLHTLIFGPPSGPPSVPDLRKELEKNWDVQGGDALFEKLSLIDPHYAATITRHDKQKIIRALEIIQLTGKKVSDLDWQERKKPLHYDFRCWFLFRSKEHLYKRIDKRCDKMLEEGFLEEVKELYKHGIMENRSACQAIGYKQALDYLSSPQTKEDYRRFVEEFKRSSRQYAKRQFTWFRKEPLFRWINLDMHDPEVIFEILQKDIIGG